jgi:3-phosphoshikimate 1-carboxyvinyltransferase
LILEVQRSEGLSGEIRLPGDKSISHRAAIVAALSSGHCRITGYSDASDCRSTVEALRRLGVTVEAYGGGITVDGRGARGFAQPASAVDAGNSGTTIRLLAGAAASSPIEVTLTGDSSLKRRPMRRIIEPLTLMGAGIEASDEEGHPPLRVRGGYLSGIDYAPVVASAQVKSAIMVAGLRATGTTTVHEKATTRDHTERMLRHAGIDVRTEGLSVSVEPGTPRPFSVTVPGDFSSAAFILAAAVVCPGSRVAVSSVGLNPTRIAFVELAQRMGAEIRTRVYGRGGWEPSGEAVAECSGLRAVTLGYQDVAAAIDEVTLIAFMATQAEGRTVIEGAGELRFKESDRITGTVRALALMGAQIECSQDGMVIEGPVRLEGARVSCSGDHRLAMMLAVAGLVADGITRIVDWEWTQVSYPGFASVLESLGGRVSVG